MALLDNLSCITDLIDVVDPCITQTDVVYWFDDNGISLATASKASDERYITGRALIDAKKRIAMQDVYRSITRNVTDSCDLDKADGLLCDNKERIAPAVWFRATALILKEIAIDSKRYNDLIHFSGSETLASMVYFDDSFKGFTNLTEVNAGQYQQEMNRLEGIRNYIETTCCKECNGTYWGISIP